MNQQKHTIGIVTLDDYTNYGNRLQNYALTRLLELQGFTVINGIRVFTKDDWINRTDNALKRMIKYIIPYFMVKSKIYYEPRPHGGLLELRKKNFLDFSNRYTIIVNPIICCNHKQAYAQLKERGVNYLIAGSDQIWNPNYAAKEYEFLTFAPKEKRVSFAASMGVDSIPEESKWFYKKNLSNMKYISVREERAAEIVKELTGRDADITLDPTLLLDKSDWELIVKKPELDINEKYICTYFLGEVPEAVKLFAQKTGVKVYPLNSQEDTSLYTIDPAEFLYMIQNASYVLTDSFHAVAFSIKFNKEFYVFDRKQRNGVNMFSRIETITKRFGLENRIQNRDRIIEQEPISNWNEIEKELVAEKNKSMGKLLEAMGI